jgi:hypothetical protein
MLEKGKIYRVTNYAVSPDAMHHEANKHHVNADGWLWVYEGLVMGEPSLRRYWLRSVATGEEAWFEEDELEGADAEEG